MFIDISTRQVMTAAEIQANHPSVIFAWTDEGLADYGYATLTDLPYPSITSRQVATQGDPHQADGKWVRGWVVSARPDDELRHIIRKEINDWRAAQEIGGVEYSGWTFDSDPSARERIQAVVLAGENPLGIWTDAENIDRPMTYEDVRGLFGAIVQRVAEIHARQRAMKAEIGTLSDDELFNYSVSWHN